MSNELIGFLAFVPDNLGGGLLLALLAGAVTFTIGSMLLIACVGWWLGGDIPP
jgi:hypothetical protein